MIEKEILINLAGKDIKVFMQHNFFEASAVDSTVHKHGYTELHCIQRGTVDYIINGERLVAKPGDLVVIPAGNFHSKLPKDEKDFGVCIFQVSVACKHIEKYRLSVDIFCELINCVSEYKKSESTVKLSAYLALVCSYIVDNAENPIHKIVDREFLVYEFFLNQYHLDVTLADLAKILNLSEKQTEREVMRCTGRHFRGELAYRRIEAAKQLLRNSSLQIQTIAQHCGILDLHYFCRMFKKSVGITPTQYKNKNLFN